MAITIHQLDGPRVFIASRVCLSLAEAQACEAALQGVPSPDAFQPLPAPELTPETEALIERGESDDPQVGSLKAGEAGNAQC